MNALFTACLLQLKLRSPKREESAGHHLQEIAALIGDCKHKPADTGRIKNLISSLNAAHTEQALELLADANNFDCMALAVQYRPSRFVPYCSGKLLARVQELIPFSGCPDRARQIRKRLELVEKWYGSSEVNMPYYVKQEIREGFKETDWIRAQSVTD